MRKYWSPPKNGENLVLGIRAVPMNMFSKVSANQNLKTYRKKHSF